MEEPIQPTLTPEMELDELKKQAETLGIRLPPRIGIETLKAKIREVLEPSAKEIKESNSTTSARKEAMRLIRCIIVNRDPAKQNQDGTLITVASSATGSIIRKWVPFHGYNEGYHIPKCVYDFLLQKKYLRVWQEAHPSTPGLKVTKKQFEPEYAIQVLPNLTEQELHELAERQRASGLK